MNWTLLVPGALLPPALAPEMARHLQLPGLVRHLAGAGAAVGPAPRLAPAGRPAAPTAAPHWGWLARRFGVADEPLASAPYAWRALGAQSAAVRADHRADGTVAAEPTWLAHCEPVHLAIARDHFVVTDLADAPLQAAEAAELLALANTALAGDGDAAAAGWRLEARGGRWFLRGNAPLRLKTWSLDAVLGQSVQDRLPVGDDARRWRVLANEVQMRWHASAATAARDSAGVRAANALWLHGGGSWRPLAPAGIGTLRLDGAPEEAAVVRGWLQAAGTPVVGGDTLAIFRGLFSAHAHQAWASWAQQMPAFAAHLEAELAAARSAGARQFTLVLCGSHECRALHLPLQPGWWQRWRSGQRAPAAVLQRWLGEAADTAATAAPGALAA